MREHRIYQADWLMRFYGFAPQEVQSATDEQGMLPLDIDPKLAWALQVSRQLPRRREPRAQGDAAARAGAGHEGGRPHPRVAPLAQARLDDVARLTLSIAKVRPFIATADWRPTLLTDRADLRTLVAPKRATAGAVRGLTCYAKAR